MSDDLTFEIENSFNISFLDFPFSFSSWIDERIIFELDVKKLSSISLLLNTKSHILFRRYTQLSSIVGENVGYSWNSFKSLNNNGLLHLNLLDFNTSFVVEEEEYLNNILLIT